MAALPSQRWPLSCWRARLPVGGSECRRLGSPGPGGKEQRSLAAPLVTCHPDGSTTRRNSPDGHLSPSLVCLVLLFLSPERQIPAPTFHFPTHKPAAEMLKMVPVLLQAHVECLCGRWCSYFLLIVNLSSLPEHPLRSPALVNQDFHVWA